MAFFRNVFCYDHYILQITLTYCEDFKRRNLTKKSFVTVSIKIPRNPFNSLNQSGGLTNIPM